MSVHVGITDDVPGIRACPPRMKEDWDADAPWHASSFCAPSERGFAKERGVFSVLVIDAVVVKCPSGTNAPWRVVDSEEGGAVQAGLQIP